MTGANDGDGRRGVSEAGGLCGSLGCLLLAASCLLNSALMAAPPAPTVGSVTHNQGPVAGGTAVTVAGGHFDSGATVVFDTTSVTATRVNANTLTCSTPAHAASGVTVRVYNTDGQSGRLAAGFTYIAAPTVGVVTPDYGTSLGGTAVTVTGTGFQPGATVVFDTTSVTANFVNATTLTCFSPAHAGGFMVKVDVYNPDGQSGTLLMAFDYRDPAPTVGGVSPSTGPTGGGTAVTVTGTGFITGAQVAFDSIGVTTTLVSATTLTCVTPAHAPGAVTVTVENYDLQTGSLAGGFTYIAPAPTVTGVSPGSGPTTGGTQVVVTGTGFDSGATVVFDTTSVAFTYWDPATLAGSTPAHAAGAVTVKVYNSDGQVGSLAAGFTYLGATFAVSAVTPAVGPAVGGTAVTVSGTGFQAGATAVFDTTSVTVNFVDAATLTCATPAHAAGAVDVSVVNPGGQTATLAGAFTYSSSPVFTTAPAASPAPGVVNRPINFTCAATDPATGSPAPVSWDFGDGHTAGGNSVSHTYVLGKVYHVTATATGTGGVQTAATLTPDLIVRSTFGQFNTDARTDILWWDGNPVTHAGSGQLQVWEMDGTTLLAETTVGTFDPVQWVVAGTGDFDGDGKADILLQHPGSNGVYVQFMDGRTPVGNPVRLGGANPALYEIIGTGDFNGDGIADAVFRHKFNGITWTWISNGPGQPWGVSAISYLACSLPNAAWDVLVGAGDFNQDGKTDLLAVDKRPTPSVYALTFNGALWVGVARIGDYAGFPVPADMVLSGAGDFYGAAAPAADGICDLLLRDSTTGHDYLWRLDGTTYMGVVEILPAKTGQEWRIVGPK